MMANLEIRYFTGDVENRELTKTQPISIGRHASNDLCIDEDDVGVMHCRIAWNKDGYELTAAGDEGVEVNGTAVQRAMLKNNDEIRVGTVDIVVLLGEETPSAAKPLPADLFEDDAPVEVPAAKPRGKKKPPPADEVMEAEAIPEAEPVMEAEPVAEPDGDEPEGETKRSESISERLRRRMSIDGARPGEQPILRSKFLIGIVVTIGVLLLVSGILWFWTLINSAETLYEEAVALHEDGKYNQAIDKYTEFLDKFPRNERVNEIHFRRGRAAIEKQVAGSASNWEEGLKAIEEFEKANRTREGYTDQEEMLRKYLRDIALGACNSALKSKKREYLPIAIEGRKRARFYKPGAEFEQEFTSLYRDAKEAVDRFEIFQAGEDNIKAALAKPDIYGAIDHRNKFLQSYPEPLPNEKRSLDALLKQVMDKEKSLVTAGEPNLKAETKDHPERLRIPRSLTLHVRPEDGQKADKSRIVIGLAKHCCYGLDAGTMQPLWRRSIGNDTPFFPIPVDVRQPSLLLFDNEFHELLLINRVTGALIWRQPFGGNRATPESLSGPPLIHQGQIYLPTRNRRLYKLDLDTGTVLAQLTFSQQLHAPPVLAPDDARLVIAGDNALLYTVALNPKMTCQSVTYLGQKPGSFQAPLLRIGKLVLACENDKQNSTRLRVLNTSDRGRWLADLTFPEEDKQIRVQGNVYDVPVLRHNQLLVASTGERVANFTVADDTELPETERNEFQFLRPGPVFQEKSTHTGPIYLTAGPNGQFWMASNRLRKFQLKPGRILEDPRETAFGRATQPPQVIGQQIYLGRQPAFSSASSMTQHNLDEMDDGRRRTMLGAKILAWNYTAGNDVIAVNEESYVFKIPLTELASGGFTTDSQVRLLPQTTDVSRPLHALSFPNGKMIVTAGGKEPYMWVVTATGQSERRMAIPDDLEADPIALGDSVVLPLPGRLQMRSTKLGAGTVGDFEAPFDATKKERPVWTFLTPLSETELVAADSSGKLMRIQVRSSGGRTYLGKVVERQLPRAIGVGMAAHQGNIVIADGSTQLVILNSATLQPTASVKTPGAITNAVWSTGDLVLAEIDNHKLLCYRTNGNNLQKVWETSLSSKAGIAGPPQLNNGALLVTERSGKLHWLDPATGNVRTAVSLAEPLDATPRVIGSGLFVPSIDGSLHALKPQQGNGG